MKLQSLILFLTANYQPPKSHFRVFSTYGFKTAKFHVYMNIHKVLDNYELVLSVPRVQERHKKPDEKTYLIFPGGWQNVHLRSQVTESQTVIVPSKLTASKEPSSEKQQLVAW